MFFRLDGLNAVTSQNTPIPETPLGLETDTDNITEDETDMQDIMTPLGGAGALQGQGNLEPYIPDDTEDTFEPGTEPPATGAAEGIYNLQAQGYNQGTSPAGMGMSGGYFPQGAAPMSSGIPGTMNPMQSTYPWQTAGTMPGTMYYCPSCPMLYGQQAYGQQMMPMQGQQPYGQQVLPMQGQQMYGQQMLPMQGQFMPGTQMKQMPYQGGTNYNRQFGILPLMMYGSQGNYYNDYDDHYDHDYDFDHDYDYDDDHDHDHDYDDDYDHDYDYDHDLNHDHDHTEFDDIEDYDYDSHYGNHNNYEDHD